VRGQIKGMGLEQRYFIDGKEVTHAEFKKAFPDKPIGTGEGITAWKRPIESDALAVHPEQIPEVLERNRRHGVHIDYNRETGAPILRQRGDRTALIKLERSYIPQGVIDRDGGYGDG
jgi:hypothetical protein